MANLPPFGLNQITKPTPRWAKKVFAIFFYSTSIVTISLNIFTEIPPHVQLIIAASVIKANLFVKAITKLFGIDVSECDQL